jgi:hypothetical protein
MPNIPKSKPDYSTRCRSCGIRNTNGVLLSSHAVDHEKTAVKIFSEKGEYLYLNIEHVNKEITKDSTA